MRKTVFFRPWAGLLLAAAACLAGTPAARADTHWSISIGGPALVIGGPSGYGHGYYHAAPPLYVAPPVYVAPPPRYYHPPRQRIWVPHRPGIWAPHPPGRHPGYHSGRRPGRHYGPPPHVRPLPYPPVHRGRHHPPPRHHRGYYP